MYQRWTHFRTFLVLFLRYLLHLREAMAGLLILLVLGGITVSGIEDLEMKDGLYFAFITGLSIGYGDIVPKTDLGRLVSVGIGLIGMLFVGLTVAVGTRALRDSLPE